MRIVHELDAFRAACDEARGRGARVGLVPTMGALHEGHLALVDRTAEADFRVVTIFVNPLQFRENEDLDQYPRTLETDAAACEARGVDLIFAPSPAAMYPTGFSTSVTVAGVTEPLEGTHRPGHLQGVTTVVSKLFLLTGPCLAVFGRKDYQQWRTIVRMVRDLSFPVEVVGHPIVREADGLALSSRNRYLSAEDRTRALGLSRGLAAAEDAWNAGERDADVLRSITRAPVAEVTDRIDYVDVVDPDDLRSLRGVVETATVVIAAHVGATRLIDNRELA